MDTAALSLQAVIETSSLRSGALSLYAPAAERISEVWDLFLSGDPQVRQAMSHARAPDGPQRQLSGNTAILPLHGPLTRRRSMISSLLFGSMALDDFTPMLRRTASEPTIKNILIDIDSPGGQLEGVTELAEEIRDARRRKPITAIANGMAAGSAYLLGSQADEFFVIPSGQVGGIGIVAVHEDISERLKKQGLNLTFVSAGKKKMDGNPFQPLSDRVRADLQSDVDRKFERFATDISLGRRVPVSSVRNGFGQGRMLDAKAAFAAGMVDGVKTLDSVVSRLRSPTSRVGLNAKAKLEMWGRYLGFL